MKWIYFHFYFENNHYNLNVNRGGKAKYDITDQLADKNENTTPQSSNIKSQVILVLLSWMIFHIPAVFLANTDDVLAGGLHRVNCKPIAYQIAKSS